MSAAITQDAYGNPVVFSTDGTTDTYVVSGTYLANGSPIYTYTFPAGTADTTVLLALAQKMNLIIFNQALSDFVYKHYDTETRVRWVQLWIETFTAGNLPNRLAYINQLTTWGSAISAYTATYITTIMAITDLAVIVAKVFDSTQFAADPQINLISCLAITN